MSEFDSVLEGLEDQEPGTDEGQQQPAISPEAQAQIDASTSRIRELEATSAANAARAETANMAAQQAAVHNEQWRQWANNQGQDPFELGDEFDGERFLENPATAREELQLLGTDLEDRAQRGLQQRITPVEQAVQAGAQQLGAITGQLNAQAMNAERQAYVGRGWNDFDEDMASVRGKFHQAGRLGELDAMLDAGQIDQVLMLERLNRQKPVAGMGDRPRETPPPSLGSRPSVNPDVAKGRLMKNHAAFVSSWGFDPKDVDLNSPELEHLKAELGGVS